MKLYKIKNYVYILLGIVFTITQSYGQILTKTKQHTFSVKKNVVIELNSTYTNIEFELTDNNTVTIETVMDIEGLSKTEANAYFKKWDFKASKQQNKLVISSFLDNKTTKNLDKHGYYKGYFIDDAQLDAITSEKKDISKTKDTKEANFTIKSSKRNSKVFNYKAYIEEGDRYLVKFQKENNEPVGKRWFNKTKKERILMQQSVKKKLPKKAINVAKQNINSKEVLKAKLKKSKLSKANVRSLPKRAIITKTLKIKIPRLAQLTINVRHGKVIFSDDITNLKADLSYVLLEANKISGTNTLIKGAYTNLEVNHWKAGSLDITFSEFALIKEVATIDLKADASLVSIDNITESIRAKGNFKMLSVELSSEIKQANIDVEDSKVVWIKLPSNLYNLSYEGIDSKLIHPKKFSLKTEKNNTSKQTLENMPLKNNGRIVKIKALSSVMQIYDILWDDLKIKSLKGL
jgi:hypothetical protein